MDNEISTNVIPSEGSVTLSIIEYHKLLKLATNKESAISEIKTNHNIEIEEKEKEVTEEQKNMAELQRKVKKAFKIISDNIAKFNIHGEKDTIRAGLLQEAMLDGLESVIKEFEGDVTDEDLKNKINNNP